MQIYPPCIPCILNMALSAIERVVNGEEEAKKIFKNVLALPALRGDVWEITSAEIVEEVWKILIREVGRKDPFEGEKRRQNGRMMEIYPSLEETIQASADPLLTAVKLAIIGNGIDAMVSDQPYEMIERIVTRLQELSLRDEDTGAFARRLRNTKRLLYLGDNAGEIVTDKLLIQTITFLYDVKVVYVVRSQPTLNDVTFEDTETVGMGEVADIMENGIDGPLPGTIPRRCSRAFRETLAASDLILSKGGGNYETLSEDETLGVPVTYMLLSKCVVYHRHFDVPIGQPILANL